MAAPHIVPSLWAPKQLYGFHGTILLLSSITFYVSDSHTSLLVAYYNQQTSNLLPNPMDQCPPGKLTGSRLLKKFFAFYRIQKFITALTQDRPPSRPNLRFFLCVQRAVWDLPRSAYVNITITGIPSRLNCSVFLSAYPCSTYAVGSCETQPVGPQVPRGSRVLYSSTYLTLWRAEVTLSNFCVNRKPCII